MPQSPLRPPLSPPGYRGCHQFYIYIFFNFFKINLIYFVIYFINLFIYLFLAALGLRCCARAFSSCGEQGLLFVAVHGLLTAVASLVAEHGL